VNTHHHHLSLEDAWEAVPEADGFLVEELLLG